MLMSGPNTGERMALMAMLVKEFPDVFAFPKATTTLDPHEADRYLAQEGGFCCGTEWCTTPSPLLQFSSILHK